MLVVVGDGTGALSSDLLNALSLAIGAVRPIGTNFIIQPPQIVDVSVSLSITCPPELSLTTVQAQLQTAIETYVTNRPLGSTLSITRISQLAYRIVPQLINISNVMLNGQGADLVAPATSMFLPQSVSFV
jgi:phage-related baseplate assembly protein